MQEPPARPARGPNGYAVPTDKDALLAWADAEKRLEDARCYWLATSNPDGSPNVRPLWGVWVERCFYFDGHPHTRWARNLSRDPRASLHLESATQVVIVDGVGEDIAETSRELGEAIASAWEA